MNLLRKLFFVSLITGIFQTIYSYRDESKLKINKCCEEYEVYYSSVCTHIRSVNTTIWDPQLHDFIFVTGKPDCGFGKIWSIFNNNSTDVLKLQPDGSLSHLLYHEAPKTFDEDIFVRMHDNPIVHNYPQGKYCMDKRIEGNIKSEFALVCIEDQIHWTTTEFMMRNIANPITHAISIICLLFIAIIYFIMPTLKDLVGNIITTMCMCLIVSQSADMARLLTVFTSHISIIITETFCYVSLLGTFFWLNSLAYYIWKTFRSKNVFLRITDGRKYCYYSVYAWSCTILMGFVAMFAHYTLDYPAEQTLKTFEEQESIGSLGIIIFFMPIAFTVIANIFFFATTMKIINRMNTYGRIHHKLKHSFRMFLLLFLTLTITWIFFLMSFSKYDGLIYCHIAINAFQGPLFVYICIYNQKHVLHQIKKTCCGPCCTCCQYSQEPECDWGDEMSAINTGSY
ncbi:probable G-protein coupled receptor Mth-like 5 [Onthophagus taurus]|uniref:probable G-protein coupled receptor Mth-like 5 n=1 Tax=Onthophagus taurus TaxID=166361 RepID=UPI0039BE3C09